jgi:hypothetical protein
MLGENLHFGQWLLLRVADCYEAREEAELLWKFARTV